MSTTTTAQPNVGSNLIRFHRVITRALAVAGERCGYYIENGFPDAATQNGFRTYIQCMITILHGHHQSEDDLAFPCFKLKLPGAPYARLEEEHRRMQPMLSAMQGAIDVMNDSPADSLHTLSFAFADLNALWGEHISSVEDHFSCQALAAVFKPEEHVDLGRKLAEYGQQHSAPHELTVPFILFNLPPDERAIMSALLPPEIVNHLIPVVWKDHWSPMKPFLLD